MQVTDAAALTVVSTYGPAAASTRTRILQWLEHCHTHATIYDYAGTGNNKLGTLLRQPVAALRGESRIRLLPGRCSGRLILQRQASPTSRGGLERRLLSSAELGIYDFDDALYATSGRTFFSRTFPKSAIADAAARAADRVIAGNDTLANWASSRCRDVRVIPTCIEPTNYTEKDAYDLHARPQICWLGSPATEHYLQPIAPIIHAICDEFNAELLVVSSGNAPLGQLQDVSHRLSWSPTIEQQLGSLADIGIAPLTDDLFAHGKCAYKLLQYAALGIPSVGSPVGANATILNALGQSVAATLADWYEQLNLLLTRPRTTRMEQGRQGLKAVRRDYSYSAWEARWLSATH